MDTRGAMTPVLVRFVSIISSFSQVNILHTGVGCIVFADDLITASIIYRQINCQSELKLNSCDHSFRQSWSHKGVMGHQLRSCLGASLLLLHFLCWLVLYFVCSSLKRQCLHFDEMFITGCTGSYQNDNFQCSQWRKFGQNDDIFVSGILYACSMMPTWHLIGIYFLLWSEQCIIFAFTCAAMIEILWRSHWYHFENNSFKSYFERCSGYT